MKPRIINMVMKWKMQSKSWWAYWKGKIAPKKDKAGSGGMNEEMFEMTSQMSNRRLQIIRLSVMCCLSLYVWRTFTSFLFFSSLRVCRCGYNYIWWNKQFTGPFPPLYPISQNGYVFICFRFFIYSTCSKFKYLKLNTTCKHAHERI